MPHENADPLPKMLPGVVCRQWVRCGRFGCRCRSGEPHGPYFYRFWREEGRLRKEYVRRRDLARVRTACEVRRQLREEEKEAGRILFGILALVRSAEAS